MFDQIFYIFLPSFRYFTSSFLTMIAFSNSSTFSSTFSWNFFFLITTNSTLFFFYNIIITLSSSTLKNLGLIICLLFTTFSAIFSRTIPSPSTFSVALLHNNITNYYSSSFLTVLVLTKFQCLFYGILSSNSATIISPSPSCSTP